MLLQIEIQSLRKVFVTVNLLRSLNDSDSEILKTASEQICDKEEIKIIKDYLGVCRFCK